MKNILISTSVAVLLASNSILSFAANVSVPNTFTSGSAAVAADVNANFTAVVNGVNANEANVTTNAGAITTETTRATAAEGTNATAIGNEVTRATAAEGANTVLINNEVTRATAAEGANNTAIGNEVTRATAAEGANTTAIAANTAAIACPTEMVAVGSLCVDKWEAAVYTAATGGTRLGAASDDYTTVGNCPDTGFTCAVGDANAIYARSETGVVPSTDITYYQATQACANVGKRLPTMAEWQLAASGTPTGEGNGTAGCNSAVANTDTTAKASGGAASCVSRFGAFDMVGNLWEWVADLETELLNGGTITTTDVTTARVLGQDFVNSGGGTPSPQSLLILDNSGNFGGLAAGPNSSINEIIGFRCVR